MDNRQLKYVVPICFSLAPIEVSLKFPSVSITSIDHSMKFYQYFSGTRWSWTASRSPPLLHGLRGTGIRSFRGRTTIRFLLSWLSVCADLF